jgi:hypothetical protein
MNVFDDFVTPGRVDAFIWILSFSRIVGFDGTLPCG